MFDMKIQVRYSEVGQNGLVKLHQILEYFQDCVTFQSEKLGLGMEEDFRCHRAWYLLAWDVKITRYPKMCEYIDVLTEPYKMRGFYGYRRYYIVDENKNKIVEADSLWILMDIKNKLPMKIPPEIASAYIQNVSDRTVRVKRKLSEDGSWTEAESIEINKFYLDSNRHVNNAFYLLWAEKLLPEGYNAEEIRVDYRQSALLGDQIKVFLQKKEEEKETLWRVKYRNQKEQLIAIVEMKKRNIISRREI